MHADPAQVDDPGDHFYLGSALAQQGRRLERTVPRSNDDYPFPCELQAGTRIETNGVIDSPFLY